jgi:hypothetical protein
MKITDSLKRSMDGALERIPVLGPYFIQLRLRRRYPIEWALIHNQHHNTNQHPSILHFSVNKAATQYVKQILGQVGAENGLTPTHLHGYAFDSTFPFFDRLSAEEFQKHTYLFHPRGYVYSDFGGAFEGIPDIEQYRTVLMVRDPRDVLTSLYYSVAYSHPEPAKNGDKHKPFITDRKHAREIRIDEYVLETAESERLIYQHYTDLMVSKQPGLYLTRYEEMTLDFDSWFRNLLAYCEFDISKKLKQILYEQAEHIKPAQENIQAHIRKGIAGDHKNKLRPDTIEKLDEIFSQVLKDFDYV